MVSRRKKMAWLRDGLIVAGAVLIGVTLYLNDRYDSFPVWPGIVGMAFVLSSRPVGWVRKQMSHGTQAQHVSVGIVMLDLTVDASAVSQVKDAMNALDRARSVVDLLTAEPSWWQRGRVTFDHATDAAELGEEYREALTRKSNQAANPDEVGPLWISIAIVGPHLDAVPPLRSKADLAELFARMQSAYAGGQITASGVAAVCPAPAAASELALLS